MKNNDIKLDLEDYKTILAHNGKIEGLVGVCNINELNEQFNENFKNLITKAKGLLVHFSLNKTPLILFLY